MPSANGLQWSARSVPDVALGNKAGDEQFFGAVDDFRAVRRLHAAAGRLQDRMPGCDVPVVRRRKPRIKVGTAFGDPAELYRRAALQHLRLRYAIDIGLGFCVKMRAAEHDDGFALRPRPDVERARAAVGSFKDPVGAFANNAAPTVAKRRRANDPDYRYTIGDERNIDR